MRESLRFVGKIVSATISRTAQRWFVRITVATSDQKPNVSENQATVGVDLGVQTMATLSTGEKIEGTKPHKRLFERVKRVSRSLSGNAKNLASLAVSSTVIACGEEGSGALVAQSVKPSSSKQEDSFKATYQ
jgi:putative transposase